MLYGYLYRFVMRLAHRFDWHYAPEIGPMEDGTTVLCCKWCGFRMRKVYPFKTGGTGGVTYPSWGGDDAA